MTLKQRDFPITIDTSSANIITDFFIPALNASVRYDRGVGYFSAGWLRLTSQGMVTFAASGGQARWVTSPILDQDDWLALQKGAAARQDSVLHNALERNIEELARTLEKDTLSALAWMVADEILDFRLALPRNKLQGGDFHDKFGIFSDTEGNRVSFNGSYNESVQGTRNYESLRIFCSWNEPFVPLVNSDSQRFERLWNNLDPNVEVYTLPEAALARILRLRTHERPYPESIAPITVGNKVRQLWNHQEEAISAWENNHRQGILSMATGSGKTLTALHIALQCKPFQFLIIAVPRANLVTQWAAEMKDLGGLAAPIQVFENRNNWQENLFNHLLSNTRAFSGEPVVIIGTMASLSGDAFQSVISDLGMPSQTLLIVDEVHNIGAPSYHRILRTDIPWRLGLSATPVRHFDEIGTQIIENFFHGTVYSYGLAQALKDKRLVPYHYDVYPAYMSDTEYEEYRFLTAKIIRIRGIKHSPLTYQTDNHLDSDGKDIEKLLFERARILKKCAEKSTLISEILTDYPPKRCLVYCADHEQLATISDILNGQKRVHLRYTSQDSAMQRKESLDALANGAIGILLAIDCLDEGVDIPVVDQAVILASSGNKRQFIQRRGRVLRRAEGKKRASLIDIIALPPKTVGHEGRNMLFGELARAKEMASLAENDIMVCNKIGELIQPYGILFSEFMSGEEDE